MHRKANPGPRRVKVKGRVGLYYRDTPQGRRYEFDFTDSTGRRRWKTVEGGLREAEAAREEVRGRLRRGEKVAPSKISFGDFADTWLAEQTNLRPRTRE